MIATTGDIIVESRADRVALEEQLRAAGSVNKGKNWHCPDPLHEDKNPSANVYEKDGAWRVKCQSCGYGGDVFDVQAMNESRPVQDVIKDARRGAAAHRRMKPTATEPAQAVRFDDWATFAQGAIADDEVTSLADALGLSVDSLRSLNVGKLTQAHLGTLQTKCKSAHAWTFPMRDATGEVVGLRLRAPDGFKWAAANSTAAAFIPSTHRGTGPLVVTEGPTDTAALFDMGVDAIGRPSNAGGGQIIADWIKANAANRDVALLIDNDDKPKAAESTAKGAADLADLLRPFVASVVIIKPPADINDARDWRKAGANGDDIGAAIEEAQKQPSVASKTLPPPPPTVSAPPAAWPKLMPIGDDKTTPLPAGIVPGWLGDMIEAVAVATETPRELATGFGLAVVATAAAGRFSVRVKQGYFEPLNTWFCAAMDSGNRKSGTMVPMIKPLVEWERAKRKSMKPEIVRAKALTDVLSEKSKKLKKDIAKASPEDAAKLLDEITETELQIPDMPQLPQLFTEDCTPETLATLIERNGERLGLISDEAGLFQMMAGLYSKGVANIDVYLKGFTGTPMRVNRGSRPPVFLNHPALSVALSPQVRVISEQMGNKTFRDRGLLARFAYLLPVSRLGFRTLDTVPVPDHVAACYSSCIAELLDIEQGENPLTLRFSDAAYQMHHAFALEVEPQMKPRAALHHIKDWAAKLPGLVARMAGLFHIIELPGGVPHHRDITAETMAAAIQFGRVLTSHALAAFGLMGADEAMVGARKILAWIVDDEITTTTKRDIHRKFHHDFTRADDTMPSLHVLAEAGYIRHETQKPKTGRPMEVYQVNPKVAPLRHPP